MPYAYRSVPGTVPYRAELDTLAKSAKPVTVWYQSETSIRRNTRQRNVGGLAGLYGGQPAHATVREKRTLRCREKCRSEERESKLGIQRNGQPFTREAPRGQASEEECAQDPDNGAPKLAKWSKEARKRRRGRRVSATQKAKYRLERRWTRRSTTVSQRRIYRSRRKGYRCKATDSRAMDLATPWYRRGRDFRGVINPLLSWRESIDRKRGRGGGECRGKLQVPRQGGRAEAKELHKTGVDGLLIKIAESEGLRVDAGVLDQGTK
ncbi:hypothetical protein BHM03_00016373 [Ensete ventricosum]|nr:hypothetical protein BHM03_00016373 [Ensete ventricosum]